MYDLQQSAKDIFRKDDRKTEECENLDYPRDESAEDLLVNLREESEKMFVTVWFQDYPNDPMQNKINQYVTDTMWKIVCSNHPNVVYTQADLSYSNRNAKSYADLAKKLYIGMLIHSLFSATIPDKAFKPHLFVFPHLNVSIFVDVPKLYRGPVIMVMHNESGKTFTGDTDFKDVIDTVDRYLHEYEQKIYGKTNPKMKVPLREEYFKSKCAFS